MFHRIIIYFINQINITVIRFLNPVGNQQECISHIGQDIFRNIIKAHAGKALFVDFWATFCGPCRGGIEHTAGLRQQYKDHPEFQFIYITSDRESPEKTYNEYVEKNLKGEACYRIPQADYNYLRQLFRFNGIPHYEWIEKDGTVLRNSPGTYNLEKYLKQRFGSKK